MHKKLDLTPLVLACLILVSVVLTPLVLPDTPGRMFLNLLKMMVLPLISGSMIAGVCALKSAGANTGKLARVAFSYFAVTTLLAVVIGLLVVNVVQPGGWCPVATACAT